MIKAEEHLALVSFILDRYFPCISKLDRRDLFQVGCIGLVKAAQGYDSTLGATFSTYAVAKIKGQIRMHFREDKWKIGSREDRASFKALPPISYGWTIGSEGDEIEANIFGSVEFESDLVQDLFIKQLISILSIKEQKVIKLLFFNGKTQMETADILGITQVQVSRLKIRSLKKMRQVALQSEIAS